MLAPMSFGYITIGIVMNGNLMKKLVHLSVAIVAIVIGGEAHAAETAGDIGHGVDLIVVTAT